MTPTTTRTLTAEQVKILDAVVAGHDVVIGAGAGTGKTATVIEVMRALVEQRKSCLYLVFGKTNQVEAAARVPRNVKAKTFHGMAWSTQGSRFAERAKSNARMRSNEKAALLGAKDLRIDIRVNGEPVRRELSRSFIAELAIEAVQAFCKSHVRVPSIMFLRTLPYADPEVQDAVNQIVREHLEPVIRAAWADLTDPRGKLPFFHDVYLKLYQLDLVNEQAVYRKYDVVFVDECQDASACRLSVARRLGKQVVLVGDENQMIFEFAGAVNVMDPKYVPDAERLMLTQSFRFGPAIAQIANTVLEQLPTELRLRGLPSIPSKIDILPDPDAVLCRSNAGVLTELTRALSEGKQAEIVGGTKELRGFLLGAQELMDTGRTEHRDLRMFDSWSAAQEAIESDAGFEDLGLFVRLIDEEGIDHLLDILGRADSRTAKPDVVLCTAHKSKGLEWDRVRLSPDFGQLPPKAQERPEERRLLYVAVTRARLVLDPYNHPQFSFGG